MSELDLFSEIATKPTPRSSPKDFEVIEISKNVAWSIYKKFHYFGEKDFISLYSFGVMYDGHVWGAITYGSPNAPEINGLYKRENQKGVLEIVRLALDPDCPRNTASWFISASIKALRKKYPLRLVITYADTAQNHTGGIYKASNFEYHGLTAPKTDLIFPDGKTRRLPAGKKTKDIEGGYWRERSRKHLYSLGVK